MEYTPLSIRAFIGAKDFNESREFYRSLGFTEIVLDKKMSYFKVNDRLGFYLQDAYVEEWVNNSMIFLEVEDLDSCRRELLSKDLPTRFTTVRLSEIRNEEWGRELFMHDPAGVLWHFGEFRK